MITTSREAEKRRTLTEIAGGPATVTMQQACADLGISKSHGYELAKRGDFPARVLIVGGRRLVLTTSLMTLLEGGAAQ